MNENIVSCRGYGRRRGRIWVGLLIHGVRLVPAINCVEGIVHGRLSHRKYTCLLDRVFAGDGGVV